MPLTILAESPRSGHVQWSRKRPPVDHRVERAAHDLAQAGGMMHECAHDSSEARLLRRPPPQSGPEIHRKPRQGVFAEHL
jgi:hypothetical protein